MNRKLLLALFATTFALGGCQNALKTMVYHIRIDNAETAYLATMNARVNVCLSKGKISKKVAYDFSNVVSTYLDLVVFDNDFYKKTYETKLLEALEESKADGGVSGCRGADSNLPELTAMLYDKYRRSAMEVNQGRSEENRRLAESMSNFRVPNAPVPQMVFPSASVPQEQKTQSFLINSGSGGLTQCRVVNNSYVFCL